MLESKLSARSTADGQGGDGCPCKRDESYLISIYQADEAVNSTYAPELGMGERREQGQAAMSLGAPCNPESSLRSKDHGTGNTKARERERGRD